MKEMGKLAWGSEKLDNRALLVYVNRKNKQMLLLQHYFTTVTTYSPLQWTFKKKTIIQIIYLIFVLLSLVSEGIPDKKTTFFYFFPSLEHNSGLKGVKRVHYQPKYHHNTFYTQKNKVLVFQIHPLNVENNLFCLPQKTDEIINFMH